MKKYLLIITLSIIIISGCQISPSAPAGQTISQSESQMAESALIAFFENLSNNKFDQALNFFEPKSEAEDSWDWLKNFSLPEDQNNKAKILSNYCQAVGTCLKAKIIETNMVEDGQYNLVVQFIDTDGSTFVLGPCCGATEEEMPPQDKFNFIVKKINGEFKVQTPPVYVP